MAVIQLIEFSTKGKTETTFAKLYNTIKNDQGKTTHLVVELANGDQLHILPIRKRGQTSLNARLWEGMCKAVARGNHYKVKYESTKETANNYAALLRSRGEEAEDIT